VDARMGEVYCAAFERRAEHVDGLQWRTVHEPQLRAPNGAPPVDGDDWVRRGQRFAVTAPCSSSDTPDV
jgi:hypothetical protein